MVALGGRGALLLLAGSGAAAVDFGGSVGEYVPTELPRSEFPAATPLQSNIAWPSGHQPQRLEAWPQTGFGSNNRTLLSCWKVEVIRDADDGWPGQCLDLFKTEFHTEQSCRQHCWDEPRCATWQYNNQTDPKQCWVGYGEHCVARKGHQGIISVQGAQRIMHGEVRVLMSLAGWKINNLFQMGLFDTGDEFQGMTRCKDWCYSNIACEFWQYGPGGCWVDAPMLSTDKGEHPEKVVQYPLTTNGGAVKGTPDALTMKYGEYIQHYCPPRFPINNFLPPLMPAHEARRATHWWAAWYFWVGLGLTVAAIIATITYVLMSRGGNKAKRAKRDHRRKVGDEEDRPLMTQGNRFDVDQELYKSQVVAPAPAASTAPAAPANNVMQRNLPELPVTLPTALPPLPSAYTTPQSQPVTYQQAAYPGQPMGTYQLAPPAYR